MNPDQETKNDVPHVDESELKMPETYEAPVKKASPLPYIIVGLLVLVLIAILVGLYLWATSLTAPASTPAVTTRPTVEENNEPESTTAEARTETIQAVSSSNELDAIEADLDATLFTDLESDFNSIEGELDAMEQ